MIATDLAKVSGTNQNGEWLGTLDVPSTANGTFKAVWRTASPASGSATARSLVHPRGVR